MQGETTRFCVGKTYTSETQNMNFKTQQFQNTSNQQQRQLGGALAPCSSRSNLRISCIRREEDPFNFQWYLPLQFVLFKLNPLLSCNTRHCRSKQFDPSRCSPKDEVLLCSHHVSLRHATRSDEKRRPTISKHQNRNGRALIRSLFSHFC